MIQPWPVQITALTSAACGTARWRKAGTSWVTVIVKATFDLVHGQLATLTTPREIVREDRYRERTGSLEEASETAPYLPGAGVLLAGHAHAPGGCAAPTAAARLAVVRERPLLDKTVHVFGDRAPGASQAQQFQKMPLVYERAFGGAGMPENPVGAGAAGTATQPNVLDPTSPRRPAGFGPISRYWPARKRLLGSGDERGLLASDPAIPEGFDWRYFHAAPPDQQIERLSGDEWIVLDGLHPSLPRVQTRLPSAVGRARWHLATSSGIGPAQAIELAADTLVIDADRLICSVVWRGRFPLERPDLAPWVRVFAGVELAAQPIDWSRAQEASAAALGLAETLAGPMRLGPNGFLPLSASPGALAGTSELDLRAVVASILPFGAPDPWRPPSAAVRRAVPQPVITRAPESLTETGELDLQHVLSAIVPFKPARPAPSPLASTGGMDDGPLQPALPFMPSDPSRPVFAAVPQPAVPRVPSPLGGTADADMQQAIRAILPFLGTPQPRPGAEPARVPVSALERPALLPEPPPMPPVYAPPMMQAPPLMQAPPMQEPPMHAPPPPFVGLLRELGSFATPPAPMPVSEPVPVPALAPVAPAAPPLAAEAPVKAPPVEEPASLRDQIFARLHARGSLQGLPLGGADLQDFDFNGASLAGLDFTRSNLCRANLAGVKAAEILLEGADLTEANFERADLTRANLSRAVVTKARFDGASLTSANLQRLSGDAPSFRTAKLQGADLRQASLPGANFDEAVLSKAQVAKADLSGSRFVRADLSSANLRDCKLREADFSRANFEGADLRNADVSRAKLDGEARKTAKLTPPQVKALTDNKP